MSIATLEQFKEFIRELSSDLDSPFQLALEAAGAEANSFCGFDLEAEFDGTAPPSDVVMAVMLLAQVHSDAGDVDTAEYRRVAAHRLLTPYRRDSGLRAA